MSPNVFSIEADGEASVIGLKYRHEGATPAPSISGNYLDRKPTRQRRRCGKLESGYASFCAVHSLDIHLS
jgi:hypothetical protein